MVVISELKTFYRIYADTRNENTGKIVAKQNDTKTRYLDITVTDNGVPVDLTGCEVRIYGRKKDGTEFYNDGTLQDATTGRCLFEATTQMLSYAGQNVNCEIVVFKENEQILSTMPFDIFVVESLMGASAVESSNEYGALVILYQNLYEAIDLMTTMVQNIGSPSTVAEQYNLETMWQAWEFLTDYMKTDLTQMIENALANSSVQGVLDKIGNTNDTGGSATEGTLMAKENSVLNIIEEKAKEIIDRNETIDYSKLTYGYTSLKTATQTPVNVTGKGKLHWAKINMKTPSGTGKLTLIIDGVTITTITVTSTASTFTSNYLILTQPRFATYMGDSNSLFAFHPNGIVSLTPNESILADGASGLKTCDLYTLDGIEFNESLVIKITGQATAYNSAHYWCIELSE